MTFTEKVQELAAERQVLTAHEEKGPSRDLAEEMRLLYLRATDDDLQELASHIVQQRSDTDSETYESEVNKKFAYLKKRREAAQSPETWRR